MNARERLNNTLNFKNCSADSGAVSETFFPWDLTAKGFVSEGLPKEVFPYGKQSNAVNEAAQYFDTGMCESICKFEDYFGFDTLKRMFLNPTVSFSAGHGEGPLVVTRKDWDNLKKAADEVINKYHTDENIKSIFSKYKEGHGKGEFSIRLAIRGFFWFPRELFGIAEHMMALYDEPELMHDINSYLCDYYLKYLDRIFDYIVPDVVYIMEDLSGTNGPMISPAHFDEYIGAYYKKLVPFMKKKGVSHIFVDTDGDFSVLIPNFISAGIEGFLPMDVNAGMDIVKVRELYPSLKFIGAYNKLEIAKGFEAIDREFERLMPVIRQGGYIVGSDHQVAPDTSLENYKYYIARLKEAMKQAGINNI